MTLPQHSTGSVEWYTPPEIVEPARQVLGPMFLDPASCPVAQKTVRAAWWYGSDGLSTWWADRVFLNPPGKSPTNPKGAKPWWNKMLHHAVHDPGFVGIYIGFNPSVLWFENSPLRWSRAICLPFKRIRFLKYENGELTQPKNPSHNNVIALVTGRESRYAIAKFQSAFAKVGQVYTSENTFGF